MGWLNDDNTSYGVANKYWLPLKYIELESEDGVWMDATVKWDGCIHLNRYFNDPRGQAKHEEMVDSIHICDLDDFIERLQELKSKAIMHFHEYGGWPR